MFLLFLTKSWAHIAQLVEHFHGKEEVAGSIPAVGTIFLASAISNYQITELLWNKMTVKINSLIIIFFT